MKKLLITLSLCTVYVQAVTVKVAILDNLLSEKRPSVNYITDYLNGIKIATQVAKSQGINVEYQFFPYNDAPLDIINKIDAVKKYHPDVIIGPRIAEQFIMLKFYFKNVLVLSPLVNADAVFKLPSNFHTMSLPLQHSAEAMYIFISKITPHPKHIFLFTAIDYTSSLGISTDFLLRYREFNPTETVINYKFLAAKVEDIDISSLEKIYVPGDIIIMPNFSYLASIIMNKVLTLINKNGILFVGGDQWGPTDIKYIENLRSKYKFTDYRMIQWSLNDGSKSGAQFRKYYTQMFNKEPTSIISYLTYKTLIFVLPFVDKNKIVQRQPILKNFINESGYRVRNNNNIYYVYKNGSILPTESFTVNLKGKDE
ncbi:MAG: hypothetical protein KBD37_01585 [Burkholderiales bacterium]|nr:hypothetical protein [Burkholderiales bacterium]